MLKYFTLFFLVTISISQTGFSQKKNAEVIKYETDYTVSSDRILTEEVSVLIQINNREGEYLTEISIPFDKNSPITNLTAHLQSPSGYVIRKLKKNEISNKSYISNSALYEDDYIKSFTLKHNTYPYRIEYSYKKTYKNFFHIANWTPIYNSKTQTENAILTLTKPSDYKIITDQNNISKPKSEFKGNFIKYTWKSNYLKLIKEEIFSSANFENVPYVKIAPENFSYGISGKQNNWTEFGNWVSGLNDGADYLPETEKTIIDTILNNLKTEKEKINALYKYLQKNTRYINVSIDIGGYKPYPASYVATNKYGDCKALTNYMKSLLSYAGIKSYYSLIYAGDKIKTINKEYSTSQFNHVILMIPNHEDTTWLECTNKTNPPGYMGTFTQGRYALVVDKNNSKLIKTPELQINETEEKRVFNFDFNDNFTSSVKVSFTLKGEMYEYLQSFSNMLNKKQKDRFIHEFVPFNNYEIKHWEIKKSKNTEALIFLNLDLAVRNYIKNLDDFKYVSLFPTEIPPFEKPNKRTQKVKINYPINQHDKLIYNKIENYNFKTLKDTSICTKYGKYKFTCTSTDKKLIIDKQFVLYSGEYPLSEYKAFYNFINSVKNIERKKVIVFNKEK